MLLSCCCCGGGCCCCCCVCVCVFVCVSCMCVCICVLHVCVNCHAEGSTVSRPLYTYIPTIYSTHLMCYVHLIPPSSLPCWTVAPSVRATPTTQRLLVGSTATFSCSATGNPTPSLRWLNAASIDVTSLGDPRIQVRVVPPVFSVSHTTNWDNNRA